MAKGENVFLRKDGRFEAQYVKGRNSDGGLVYDYCYGRIYQEARAKADQDRKRLEERDGAPFVWLEVMRGKEVNRV